MGSGGVSLLYRREKGKTRMGEETLRGEEGTFREKKGGKGKGKGGFIKKLGALQAAEFFFLTGKKFFSSWKSPFRTLSSIRMLEEWMTGA